MWAPLECSEVGPTAGRGSFGCWGMELLQSRVPCLELGGLLELGS